MTKNLFTNLERQSIFDRCEGSAYNQKLTNRDIGNIINKFERHNIPPSKIGNIIKYICVLIEERNKKL